MKGREPWTLGEVGLALLAVGAAVVGAVGWFWIIFR
jgi:hypothetical protein